MGARLQVGQLSTKTRSPDREPRVLGTGQFGTDRDGYQAMLDGGRHHTGRIWAVEGCTGIGRHVTCVFERPASGVSTGCSATLPRTALPRPRA
jgi:hypothetical protein